jgi:peroxiredoxin Q/BCP
MPIAVGTSAPDFTLRDQDGAEVSLADLRRSGKVVLFFYPKDETYGCTREACAFRDEHERFRAAGAEVVGISDDPPDAHGRFRARHRLPMRLLSDPGGAVRGRYGVTATFGVPDRVTFVIDRDGVVRHVFSSRLRFAKHVDEALAAAQAL